MVVLVVATGTAPATCFKSLPPPMGRRGFRIENRTAVMNSGICEVVILLVLYGVMGRILLV